MITTTFRALTVDVAISIVDGAAFRDLVEQLVSTYPAAGGSPTLTYELSQAGFRRDGGALTAVEDPADVVPRFEIDLYEQVIARARDGLLLHAAAVEVDGRALVFAGPSGAGKTTLALELVARGHRLLTEEVVWIGPELETRGLARPLHTLPEGIIPPATSEWRRVEYPMRGAAEPRYLVLPPANVFQHDGLPLGALVRLTHGPDRDARIARLTAGDALSRFWESALRHDETGLVVAARALSNVSAYRLSSRTFAEALECLNELLRPK